MLPSEDVVGCADVVDVDRLIPPYAVIQLVKQRKKVITRKFDLPNREESFEACRLVGGSTISVAAVRRCLLDRYQIISSNHRKTNRKKKQF